MGKSGYDSKGLYNRYDKSHAEREALDYYSTPPGEVLNILRTLNIDFSGTTILEPCIGGGHMAEAIDQYLEESKAEDVTKIGTDIQYRGFKKEGWKLGYGLDYFADDYPHDEADWVILNPPYGVIEPFMIRTLEIAKKGVIMLGRIQFLEGEGRWENIFKNNPPSAVWVYVDRIQCWKNGVDPGGSSAQSYAWFIWEREKKGQPTEVHWLRRANKKEI